MLNQPVTLLSVYVSHKAKASRLSIINGDDCEPNALIAGSAALQTERGVINRFLLGEPHGKVHFYDKHHLFRMADKHPHYQAGDKQVVFEWRGWRIMPLICYDLRLPVWSRNRDDYDLLLYVANWPAPCSLH